MIDERGARRFLALPKVAVVGASTDRRKFGNAVFRALLDHGIDAVPVHPSATEVEGRAAVASVGALPDDVEGVLVMVDGPAAAEVVRAAAARGIEHVWLFRGLGSPGAFTGEALVEALGMEVVAGACPLMFLEPVRGAHRFHRWLRRRNGSLCSAA